MRWTPLDSFAVLSALGWLVGLAANRVIQPQLVAGFLIAITLVMALGHSFSNRTLAITRNLFRVGLPAGSLITLGILLAGSRPQDLWPIFSGLATIAIMLLVLYFMVRKIFHP